MSKVSNLVAKRSNIYITKTKFSKYLDKAVEAFISHALEVFECLKASPEIRQRLVAVNSCSNVQPFVTNGDQSSDVNRIIEILISGCIYGRA